MPVHSAGILNLYYTCCYRTASAYGYVGRRVYELLAHTGIPVSGNEE